MLSKKKKSSARGERESVVFGWLRGWHQQSKAGNEYISLSLTIPDLDVFLDNLEDTEYGYRARGVLFPDEDGVKGNFSVLKEEEKKAPTATRQKQQKKKAPPKVEEKEEDEWGDEDE
jgi:uncharacterized protein (DUF736 family)